MSRIENHIAGSVADVVRAPQQQQQDRQSQVAQATLSHISDSDAASAVAEKDPESVAESIAQVQKVVDSSSNRGLDFRLASETNDFLVDVIDRNTDEVIKQIPAESVVELRQRLDDLVGTLIDEVV